MKITKIISAFAWLCMFVNAQSFEDCMQDLINGNYKKALQGFERLCMNGDSGACYQLGILYSDGENAPKNFHKSVAFYEQACNANVMAACNNLGVMFENGYGVEKKDYTQAGLYYTDACMGKSAKGCYNLAVLVYAGNGIKKDRAMAKEYYGLSCDFGLQAGCDEFKKLNLE